MVQGAVSESHLSAAQVIKAAGWRYVVNELVTYAQCRFGKVPLQSNRDGAMPVASPILVALPGVPTTCDSNAFYQIEEFGGKRAPASGSLKRERHEGLRVLRVSAQFFRDYCIMGGDTAKCF